MTGSTTSFIIAASTSLPASTAPHGRARSRSGPHQRGRRAGLIALVLFPLPISQPCCPEASKLTVPLGAGTRPGLTSPLPRPRQPRPRRLAERGADQLESPRFVTASPTSYCRFPLPSPRTPSKSISTCSLTTQDLYGTPYIAPTYGRILQQFELCAIPPSTRPRDRVSLMSRDRRSCHTYVFPPSSVFLSCSLPWRPFVRAHTSAQ